MASLRESVAWRCQAEEMAQGLLVAMGRGKAALCVCPWHCPAAELACVPCGLPSSRTGVRAL